MKEKGDKGRREGGREKGRSEEGRRNEGREEGNEEREEGDEVGSTPWCKSCGEECDVRDEVYWILRASECDYNHIPALVMHYLWVGEGNQEINKYSHNHQIPCNIS